jgi:hypothetical protein
LLEYDHGRHNQLIEYHSYGEYTADNADKEAGAFLASKNAQMKFPGAFSNKGDLISQILKGEVVYLSRESMLKLENSDVKKVLKASLPKKVAMKLAEGYGKDWERIVNGLLKGDKILPSIVIQHNYGHYLLAGNARLMVGSAWGFNMPVKVVDIKGP